MSSKKLSWSDTHEKNLNALYNKFKEEYPDTIKTNFINKNKRKLLSFIESIKDIGDSRKKTLLFTVGRYLDINNNDRYADIYKQAAYNLYQKIENDEAENKQSEKEKKYYMSMSTIRHIYNTKEWNLKNQDEHNQYLLISLIIYQAPLRPDFYITSKIIYKQKDDDKKNNFLLINRKIKKIHYIINNDKISKTKNHLDKIEIENNDLKTIIFNSVKLYPRTYLFEYNNENISYVKFSNILKKALNNKGITFSMVRSSYINDFYEKNKTIKDKINLASKMRHTAMTAMTNYHKIEYENSNMSCDDIRSELRIKEINELEPSFNEINKKRNNVLIKINNRNSTPRDKTIKEYNLKYENDKWV